MSRNFELLKNIGREQDFFQIEAPVRDRERVLVEPAPLPEPSVPEPHIAPPSARGAVPGPSSLPFSAHATERAMAPPIARAVAPGADAPAPAAPEPLQFSMEDSQIAELAKLVQRVFLLPGADSPRVVVFSGGEPGDGCSWICARVGELLARRVAGSVCLVDANLRNPTLHEEFSVPNHHGLSEALRHSGSIRGYVSQLSRRNLALLSCGSELRQVQGMIGSERMRTRLRELREEFEYVLVDCSSVSLSNEAVAVGLSCDGLVLVLKANSTRKDRARGVVQELKNAKVRVLGAVLNQRTFPIPESIYNKL